MRHFIISLCLTHLIACLSSQGEVITLEADQGHICHDSRCDSPKTQCTPCELDDICGEGNICVATIDSMATMCAFPCQSDIDCAEGFQCTNLNTSSRYCIVIDVTSCQ
jgi:hypothetical protein